MERMGRALCAAALLGGSWVVVSLWLGGGAGLPLHAIAAVAAIAALLGASGLALRSSTVAAVVWLIGFGAPLANTRLVASQDTVATAWLPFAIVREHALTLPASAAESSARIPLASGRFAPSYPVATALLALPFALPAAAGRGAPTEPLRNVTEKLAAAALCATMLAFLYLAAARLAGARAAAGACALTLFGSAALPILGQALWQHTGAALALSAGLAALVLLPDGHLRGAGVGFCAGLVVACRAPDLPLATALLAALFLRGAHTWAAALGAAAVPLLLTAGYQWSVFGGPFSTGYGGIARTGWRPLWPDGFVGLAGLWLSPGRGLALISPVLLFGLVALLRGDAPLRALGIGVLAQSALMGCWWAWHGAWSAGPRMLSDAIPFLGLGLARALGGVTGWNRGARALFGCAAAVSCGCALLLTYAVPGPQTHALVWGLRDGPWVLRAHPVLAYLREPR
jgi:hypothetical protein